MRLTKCVTTRGEGDCFVVVHCHAGKGLADIAARGHGVWDSIGAFWVDVDQSHLDCGQWVFKFTVTRVAAVGQPFVL